MLRHEEGIRAAQNAGILGDRCYYGCLLLDQPTLLPDNAERILRYLPGVAEHRNNTRYILGVDNFVLDRRFGRIKYDIYLADHCIEEFDHGNKCAALKVLPVVTSRLVFSDPYYQLEVVDTPTWIHQDERTNAPSGSLQTRHEGTREDREEPANTGDDVPDFDHTF